MKKHKIVSVAPGSIAAELELRAGDFLLSINGQEVVDILDYRWLTATMAEECLVVEIQKPDGEIWELEIEADDGNDLGLNFHKGSMGEDRRCVNACIFCFVDQQPPGLRPSLYVKDDDPYQSFVLGNYITLTNLGGAEIQQIIKHRLSPLRISVHTADMELRQRMMGSPRAAQLLETLARFSRAGLDMHFQIVLCKGVNDGAGLDYSIGQLLQLGECAKSLAVVPVGLTKYRDGLHPLKGFTKEDATAVISQIEKWQAICLDKTGGRFVFPADEWYVLAGKPVPGYDEYEDFPQLDNGVGMLALFEAEFREALAAIPKKTAPSAPSLRGEAEAIQGNEAPQHSGAAKVRLGIVTGKAAGEFMVKLSKLLMESFPDIAVDIHVIENEFYGPGVTVSGLLTGRDIIGQLKGRCSGMDALFIPENAFRTGTEDMLCGTTLKDVSKALGVAAIIGAADGGEFCRQLVEIGL